VRQRLTNNREPIGSSVSRLRGVQAGDTVVLTVVSGASEAEVVCGLLRSNGIECAHRDTDRIDSSLEDFIAAGAQEILVHQSDFAAAKELLPAT
jgi:Putative prokaryotic signal transducing protein